MSALSKLQKDFPQVEKVIDARRSIRINVTKADGASARSKDPNSCALVKACIREKLADAAVVGIGSTYLIRGTKAIRFKTSHGVAREITSFDRHHEFAEGTDYVLSKVSPGNRLGVHKRSEYRQNTGKRHAHTGDRMKHHTSNIRILRKPKK